MCIDKEERCLELLQKKLGSIEGTTRFFGCSIEEEREIKRAILESERNLNANDFPDFIFEDGFIEHFQVTSAKEGKKGSAHAKNEAECDRNFEKKCMQNNNTFGNITKTNVYSETHDIATNSHEYLNGSRYLS